MYKRLQEYNTSLQQYNSKLQSELATTNETLKRVEKEKAAVVENLSTLRGHYTSLQDQLTTSRVSLPPFLNISNVHLTWLLLYFVVGNRCYIHVHLYNKDNCF